MRGFWDYFVGQPRLDAVWLAGPISVAAIASFLSPIRPFDYFWVLVQGRAILQLGRIPTENSFLFTMPVDAPFVNQPWLAELLLHGVYASSGHFGNVVLLGLLQAFALIWLMDGALRSGASAKIVALAAFVAMLFLAPGSGVRTQMFAYPCFAIILRRSLAELPRPSARTLAPILATSAVWANVHGSFVLAPLIVGVTAIARVFEEPVRQRRAWALRTAAIEVGLTLLSICLNPQGPKVFGYALRIGVKMRVAGGTDVTEWQPLSWSEPLSSVFAAIVVAGVVVATIRRRHVRALEVVLWFFFALLALKSQRFLGWWALSSIPAISALAPKSFLREDKPGVPLLNGALLALLLALALGSVPGGPIFERFAAGSHVPYDGDRALGVETPLKTAELLAASGYEGNVFHNQALGGLLEWTLCREGPKPVAFVDQRFELTPQSLWTEYFAIAEGRDDWKALLERRKVGTLLIHEVGERGLVRALEGDPEWRLVRREFAYRLYTRARAAP